MSDDLRKLLDDLDAARDSIGDSPAFRVVGFTVDEEEPEWARAQFDDGGATLFAECYGADAAALIVAAVNNLPRLTAAVRAVLDLADDFDDGDMWGAVEHPGYKVRNRILAALNPAPPDAQAAS